MENHLRRRNLYLQDMIKFMNLFFTIMVTLLENRRPHMCMNVFYQKHAVLHQLMLQQVALQQNFTVHQNVFQKQVLQQTVLKQHVL